jgi:CAI-1 autoinducer synthase
MNQPFDRRAALPDFVRARIEAQYHRRIVERWGDRRFSRSSETRVGAVRLDTNDYLDLACHPAVVRARADAIARCADPTLMSATFLAEDSAQVRFERAFAAHWKTDDAILCQSGWAANVGLLQAITGPSLTCYVDHAAHMSLWEGARRADAVVKSFRHNDVAHLERQIRDGGPGIILVDSVYSTDGSVCPLVDVADVASCHGCVLVADESHSLGTHGPEGVGLVEALGLRDQVPFRTASLSKAFASRGGVIGCPAGFVPYFRLESKDAIFSSAVHGYEAVGFQKTLEVVRAEEWRRTALEANAAVLREGLAELGYPVAASRSQIIALEAGTEYATLKLRDLLAERGVLGAPFVAPATATHRALVRLTVTAGLDSAAIRHVLDVCREIRDEAGVRTWAATRREERSASQSACTSSAAGDGVPALAARGARLARSA